MSAKKLVEPFGGLEDPRCTEKIEHLLIDILVIAVCAVIAGAESWVDMELYGEQKAEWLATLLVLPNGIPAHDTCRRVFMLIDPKDFESRFTPWTGQTQQRCHWRQSDVTDQPPLDTCKLKKPDNSSQNISRWKLFRN